MKRALLGCLVLAVALLSTAAAQAVPDLELDIGVATPPAAEALGQAVAVTFVDGRELDLGGGDAASFGVMKSSVTRRIVHEDGIEVGEFTVGYVVGALRAAGIDARGGIDPALPTLRVTLLSMMAMGFTHFEVPVEARLELTPAGGAAPVWSETLTTRGDVTLFAGPGELVQAYDEALTSGLGLLDTAFRSPAFGQALAGPTATAAGADGSTPPPPPPPPPPPAPPAGGVVVADASSTAVAIDRITEGSAEDASKKLEGLCLTHFEIAFGFRAEDESSEWTVTFLDEDGDKVGYVNLDDEDTIEFDGDDEDLDDSADAGEAHRAVISVEEDEVTVHINGEEIIDDEDLDDYDECLHLAVKMDDDMVLTGFAVTESKRPVED